MQPGASALIFTLKDITGVYLTFTDIYILRYTWPEKQ